MEAVFLHFAETALTAGWVVLAVLLLRLLLKKAPKWITVLLWGVVAVRLLLPFSIESAVSVIPAAPSVSVPSTSQMVVSSSEETGVTPPLNQEAAVGESAIETTPTVPEEIPMTVRTVSWTQLATVVWLAGMIGMLVYAVISYVLLYRRVRTATRLEGRVFQSEAVESPFVLGVLRPRIYLPYHLDAMQRDSVLRHEQAHIRRGDHIIKPLGFLLLSVYWFHPLLWVAYVLLCRDIELACDERAIKTLTEDERRGYSLALVEAAVGRRRIAACPLAFGEVAVKARVKSVMHYKKPAFWIVLAAVVVSVAAAAMLLTDRPSSASYATFEGAELYIARINNIYDLRLPLEPDESGEPVSDSLRDHTPIPVSFTIKKVDVQSMSVTVELGKPMLCDGETLSTVEVPYDSYRYLEYEEDGQTSRFLLRVEIPTALDEEPQRFASEDDDRVVCRYTGGGWTLMLYNKSFRLCSDAHNRYTPTDILTRPYLEIAELEQEESTGIQTPLFLDDSSGAVYVKEEAVGRYEFTDDGRLILTEDGGLTRYVFTVGNGGQTLTHCKEELSRHERAVSPALEALTLTKEYTCTIDCHAGGICDFTVADSSGATVAMGESLTRSLALTSLGDGRLRITTEDSDGYLRQAMQDVDLHTGLASPVYSQVLSANANYIAYVWEENGKVGVTAQQSFWCGTGDSPRNLTVELYGLTSLESTRITTNVGDKELTVCYLDDAGEEHVIARDLKTGDEITRTLIVVAGEDTDTTSGRCYHQDNGRSLYYGGVYRVYCRVDGKYGELYTLLENGKLTLESFEELLLADAKTGVASGVTYRDGGSIQVTYEDIDAMHTVTFRHTVNGDHDIYVGTTERDGVSWATYYDTPDLYHSGDFLYEYDTWATYYAVCH